MFDLNRRHNWPTIAPVVALIIAPIHIKHIYMHSSVSYQSAIYPKYDWRGHESPSGYGL